MDLSKDNKVVCLHGWESMIPDIKKSRDKRLTLSEFKSRKINKKKGNYTTLIFEDIIRLMRDYPDIWIITDSKYPDSYSTKIEFKEINKLIMQHNATDILDRFVVQIYNSNMYYTIEEIMHVKHYIFTMYMIWWNSGREKGFENHCKFSKKVGIKYITVHVSYVSENVINIANKYDIKLYVHTVNDVKVANNFIKMGIYGIYTDDLIESDLDFNLN